MKCRLGLGLGLLLAAADAANPIRKVVNLLQDMQKEIEAEAKQEEELYEKFVCYVKTNTANLTDEAREQGVRIQKLRGEADEEEAQKKQLQQDLVELKKNRAAAVQSLALATATRKKENAAFEEAAGETAEYMAAMDNAIKALEHGTKSFLQSNSAKQLRKAVEACEDPDEKELILAFLSSSSRSQYAPQSTEVIGILRNMRDEMDTQTGGIHREEKFAVKSYNELKAAKASEIQASSQAIEKKTRLVGELGVSVVEKRADADNTEKAMGEKQAFALTLETTGKEKAEQWAKRNKERHEELSAIHEAITVLNDDEALDVFKKSMPSKPSFLQRRSRPDDVRNMLLSVMNGRSQHLFSNAALSLLAHTAMQKLKSNNQAQYDFSEVHKMIDQMVNVLKEEQKEDDTTRDQCIDEFHESELRMKDAKAKLKKHENDAAVLSDNIAGLKAEIDENTKQIQELDKSVEEATEQRKKEHDEYVEQGNLNVAAVQLIEKAKNKLNKYYNPKLHQKPKQREMTREEEIYSNAGGEVDTSIPEVEIAGTSQTTALSFVEIRKQPQGMAPMPETFDGEYKNKGQKSGSIMALMDMLKKDLENQITESKTTEASAQKSYEKLMGEAQKQKMSEQKAITDSSSQKADQETKLEEAKEGVSFSEADLHSEINYEAELHQKCDFITTHYDMRKDAREREREGLKHAQAVLRGADFE